MTCTTRSDLVSMEFACVCVCVCEHYTVLSLPCVLSFAVFLWLWPSTRSYICPYLLCMYLHATIRIHPKPFHHIEIYLIFYNTHTCAITQAHRGVLILWLFSVVGLAQSLRQYRRCFCTCFCALPCVRVRVHVGPLRLYSTIAVVDIFH